MDSWQKKLEESNKLIFVGEYKKAKEILYELISSSMDSPNYLVILRLAELENKLGDFELFVQQIKEKAWSNDLVNHMVSLVSAHQDPDFILDDINKNILNDDQFDQAVVQYCRGICFEKMKSLNEAQKCYGEVIKINQEWYPAFFALSQIHYQLGDMKKGDNYFYMYEKKSPYSVYGNIETHRFLAKFFMEREEFTYAKKAILSLSKWWEDNKNYCPDEIKIFESLYLSKISFKNGNVEESKSFQLEAFDKVNSLVQYYEPSQFNVAVFVAKILEENNFLHQAINIYKCIIKYDIKNDALVSKMAMQILTSIPPKSAEEIFINFYKEFPNNDSIRLCLLISRLKQQNVDIEEYLYLRDKLLTALDTESNGFYLLEDVSKLMRLYDKDYEVHFAAAQVFTRLQSQVKRKFHFEKMLDCDPLGSITKVNFAEYLLGESLYSEAMDVLDEVDVKFIKSTEASDRYNWVKSICYNSVGKYTEAIQLMDINLKQDPWNIAFLQHQIDNLELASEDSYTDGKKTFKSDPEIFKYLKAMDWEDYYKETCTVFEHRHFQLAYLRSKLFFLYQKGNDNSLDLLLMCAKEFYEDKCISDLTKLLNTNYDHPGLYLTIGMLYKSMNQLESAYNWFKLIFDFSRDKYDYVFYKTYASMAECLMMMGRETQKAIEYSLMCIEHDKATDSDRENIYQTLALCYLKQGQTKKVKPVLHELHSESFTNKYIKGLFHMRSGSQDVGKKIWKPLISSQVDSIKEHEFKKDILRLYYGEPASVENVDIKVYN